MPRKNGTKKKENCDKEHNFTASGEENTYEDEEKKLKMDLRAANYISINVEKRMNNTRKKHEEDRTGTY